MENPYLQNDRILLRNVEPEDLDVIYQIENMPELWEVSNTSVPFSRYVLRQYLETTRCDLFADKQLRLIIEFKDRKETAGMVDLADYEPLHNRAATGIVIRKEYRQQGIGRQALELLCDYCSRYLHLKQLYAFIPADNPDSLKLFASCGFVRSGTLNNWLHSEAGYKDAEMLQKLFS